MKAVIKFTLDMEVNNPILEELMSNEESKKITLDIFKKSMEEDLMKSLPVDNNASVCVTNIEIK